MPIRVWDYLDEYERDRDAILEAVDRVFRSGALILGPRVAEFERAFATYCGARHGVGVDNGTNALTLGLHAVGLERGREVITVPNTAVPTVSAIVAAGGVPRFVDIDPDTYVMSADQVARAASERTGCLLPVHLFGQCAPMPALRRIADARGIPVIEDCAQSHGATHDGRRCGSMGDLAAFSCYPTKVLGAYGDAGIIVTDRADLDARLRRLRFYGMDGYGARHAADGGAKAEYVALEDGYNSRLDEVQAAILLLRLSRLDADIARRRAIADRYDRALEATSLTLPRTAPGNSHVYYLYVCRHPDRDRILSEMARRDVLLNVSYPTPVHLMPAYGTLGYGDGDFPEAERAAREIFSLPMYPTLTDAQQDHVCRSLGEVLGEPVLL